MPAASSAARESHRNVTEDDAGDVRALAGAALRQARGKRGLTQRALADLAGVAQTTVARIESGRHQPSLPTLAGLLGAAGFRPRIVLENAIRPSELLALHRDEIRELAARHDITRVRVFGSVARGEDRPDSDIDLLLDFKSDASLFNQASFTAEAEEILGVRVDAVSARALRPPRALFILHDAQDL